MLFKFKVHSFRPSHVQWTWYGYLVVCMVGPNEQIGCQIMDNLFYGNGYASVQCESNKIVSPAVPVGGKERYRVLHSDS